MTVTIKEITTSVAEEIREAGGPDFPAEYTGDSTSTHIVYIIDDASGRPLEAGLANSLTEAEEIKKVFEEKVASM